MQNEQRLTYLFSNGRNLFIRVCENQDRVETAQYMFSADSNGAIVNLIAIGPEELSEQCFCRYRDRWYWHGMYGFDPEMLRKFAPTSNEYDVAIGKIRATRYQNKWEKFRRKISSKIQSAINEMIWVLGLNECEDEYDRYNYDDEI
ncbi:MAG: hypothetical protein F6K50_06335 [Moorea sp. SIO3I7]|nr:hypothetical protein [Moorena sp. SIO3I7]